MEILFLKQGKLKIINKLKTMMEILITKFLEKTF